MSCDADTALIHKEIVHAGTRSVDFKPGTKVQFHYVTKTCGADATVIDDSRVLGQPMELVLGKSFKLECWEVMVQKMAVNEVARFRVDKSVIMNINRFVKNKIRINRTSYYLYNEDNHVTPFV